MQGGEEAVAKLTKRLQHTDWIHGPPTTCMLPPIWLPPHLDIHVGNPFDRSTSIVHAKLSVLRAMRVNNITDMTVRIGGWEVNAAGMKALSGLPHWGCVLDFTDLLDTVWSLTVAQATQLAAYVPTSYKEWQLGSVSEGLLFAICAGVSERRAALRLEPLIVRAQSAVKHKGVSGRYVKLVAG